MYTQYVKRGKNETFIKISISVSLAANTFKKMVLYILFKEQAQFFVF